MPVLPEVGDLFGRYRIDRQIGHGGMGVVYAATDTELGRTVALKVVHAALGEQEFLERFKREAEVLARLNSPHVIAIYDVGEHEGSPYIVTQFISGGDLGDLIKARGAMPPHLAAAVCTQVAEALSDAHRVGVIHRDVKPSNVLLRDPDNMREPMVYLCDFGIAHTEQDGVTQAGTVSGTWSYLSPECGRGEPASVASDVYALGCLLWAAISGRAPYSGTDVEIAVAHQTAPIPQLAGDDPLSSAINQVLRTSMAKEPWARYETMDQMRDALASLRQLPVPAEGLVAAQAGPDGPSGTGLAAFTSARGDGLDLAPRPKRRKGLVIGAAAAALVLVAGGGTALAITAPWSSDSPTAGPSEEPSAPAYDGPVRGDADGDGLGDVVLQKATTNEFENRTDWQLSLFSSDGEGSFTPTFTTESTEADGVIRQIEGDFDGDGTTEIGRIWREKADDTLTFSSELSSGETMETPLDRTNVNANAPYIGFETADLEGDGDDDLFWVNYDFVEGCCGFDGVMTVFAHPFEDGEAQEPVVLWRMQDGAQVVKLSVGDVNDDQKADLVGLLWQDRKDNVVGTWLGDGTTMTAVEERTPVAYDGTASYAKLVDLDGDGQDEYVMIEPQSGNDEIRIGEFQDGVLDALRTRGAFRRPDGSSVPPAYYTVADVNGDGRVDLVQMFRATEEGAIEFRVALSGGASFGTPTTWAQWPDAPRTMVGSDLMGDDFL